MLGGSTLYPQVENRTLVWGNRLIPVALPQWLVQVLSLDSRRWERRYLLGVLGKMLLAQRENCLSLLSICVEEGPEGRKIILELWWNPVLGLSKIPPKTKKKKWKEDFDDIAEPLNQALLQRLDYFWILRLYESLSSLFWVKLLLSQIFSDLKVNGR